MYLYVLKIVVSLSCHLPVSVAFGFLFGIRCYEAAWLMHSGFTCLKCCWAHFLLSAGGSWLLTSSSGLFVYKMLAFSSFFWVCCWHLLPSVIFGTYNFGFLR